MPVSFPLPIPVYSGLYTSHTILVNISIFGAMDAPMAAAPRGTNTKNLCHINQRNPNVTTDDLPV